MCPQFLVELHVSSTLTTQLIQTGPEDFAGPVEIKFEDFWKNSIIKRENFGKMLEINFEENAFFDYFRTGNMMRYGKRPDFQKKDL